jgi:hypothetical protein
MGTITGQYFQFGGMPVGGGVLAPPSMGKNAKSWFVDPASGSDNNAGDRQDKPLDTVGKVFGASGKAVDKRGDIAFYLNDGNTTGSSREATIPMVWSNDNNHLVGCCAPVPMSQRARITPAASAALLAQPVISMTGHGNSISNVQIAHWGADTDAIAARGLDVTGNRNYFYNCHIVGIPNAHTGDEAAACDLKVTGEENMFERCYFGVNTVTRSTTNACVELTGGATRIHFKDCFFTLYADNAGALFVKIDAAADIDREIFFENCTFYNAVGSGSTALTAAMSVHASAGGDVVVKDCMLIGAPAWTAADATNVRVLGATTADATEVQRMGIAQSADTA